jgi:hypothetical protein
MSTMKQRLGGYGRLSDLLGAQPSPSLLPRVVERAVSNRMGRLLPPNTTQDSRGDSGKLLGSDLVAQHLGDRLSLSDLSVLEP